MKQLTDFLKSLPNKTAWITAMMFAAIMLQANETLFNHNGLVITELVGSILLLVFKGLAPTGQFPKGMNTLFWVTNILILLVQSGDLLSGSLLLSEKAVLAIGNIQVTINAVLAALVGLTPPPADRRI